MILQALYQLAMREDLVSDPDFEPKQIAWLVRISPEGKLIGIQGTHYIPPEEAKKKKPKPVPRHSQCPERGGANQRRQGIFSM